MFQISFSNNKINELRVLRSNEDDNHLQIFNSDFKMMSVHPFMVCWYAYELENSFSQNNKRSKQVINQIF